MRHHKAAYSRLHQMLLHEYRARKHGTELGSQWTKNLHDAIVVSYHSSGLRNAAMFLIHFVLSITRRTSAPASWAYSKSLPQTDWPDIGHRIAIEIQKDALEQNTLQLRKFVGGPPTAANSPLTSRVDSDWGEDSLEWARASKEYMMIKTLFPLLPSTQRLLFHQLEIATVQKLRQKHRQKPLHGSYILLRHPSCSETLYFPARIKSHNAEQVVMEWFAGVFPPLPPLQDVTFQISYSEWEKAMDETTLSCSQICPIQWPALLMYTPRLFPSPLYPTENALSK
ncbi:hypothetical protein DFH07DRAFT_765574 [Mycena maculata]|uniref:Uncharacterized protein n=1 Tax=Mycena maculata TaxID=230809 RepID=A0AAD7K889_9AGAR|nr:hypothetical protein DFH07DRAFT_765574 [Mycena maculata]